MAETQSSENARTSASGAGERRTQDRRNGDRRNSKRRAKDKSHWPLAIALIATLVVGGAGGGIATYLAGWLQGAPSSAPSKVHDQAEAPPPEPIVYYDFPEIVVDLRAGPCPVSYIKILPVAELASEAQKTRLQEVEPRVLHGFQSFLCGRTRTDLIGEDGTETLRSAFLGILSTEMKPSRPNDVLFHRITLN